MVMSILKRKMITNMILTMTHQTMETYWIMNTVNIVIQGIKIQTVYDSCGFCNLFTNVLYSFSTFVCLIDEYSSQEKCEGMARDCYQTFRKEKCVGSIRNCISDHPYDHTPCFQVAESCLSSKEEVLEDICLHQIYKCYDAGKVCALD